MFKKIRLNEAVAAPIERVENDEGIRRYMNLVGELT
jgi:hypothetical protein